MRPKLNTKVVKIKFKRNIVKIEIKLSNEYFPFPLINWPVIQECDICPNKKLIFGQTIKKNNNLRNAYGASKTNKKSSNSKTPGRTH